MLIPAQTVAPGQFLLIELPPARLPVQNGDHHRADEHLAARGAIVSVTHAEIGPERQVRNPIRPGRTPLAPERAAPLLGAHTEEVLGTFLGIDREAVARLVEEGVCR